MLRRLKKKYFTKKTSDLLLQVFLFFNFQSKTVCPGSGLTKKPGPDPDSQHRKNNVEKYGGPKNIFLSRRQKFKFLARRKEPRNFWNYSPLSPRDGDISSLTFPFGTQ